MRRAMLLALLGLGACDRPAIPAEPTEQAAAGPETTVAAPPEAAAPGAGVPEAVAPEAVAPEAVVPEPSPAPTPEIAPTAGAPSDGAPSNGAASNGGCRSDAECGSGASCVGAGLEGCGGAAGRCERDAKCTRDAQTFCGCDGVTFRASSRCPGKEYAHAGECRAQGEGADGSACGSERDCASGICEGRGCGPHKTGTCMPSDRTCTTDAVVYCGCDHQPFRASSRCPGRRYRNLGDCHR